jgi:hypothetical protein
MSARRRLGTYTSNPRDAYLVSRISYDGERRVTSTVLHCRMKATMARGLAHTVLPVQQESRIAVSSMEP